MAVFDPIYLAGTKVERATLNNQAFIKKLGINIGDTVTVRKAAEIIPEIIGCSKGNNDETGYLISDYTISEHVCPSCGGKIETAEDLKSSVCRNPECPAQLARKFEFWASRDCMDIRGLGPAQIDKFIQLGWLKSIPDIYKLEMHQSEMERLEGFGRRSASSLINSINKSKDCDIDRLIKALGIEGVGRHVGKKLAKKYPTIFDVGGYTVGIQTESEKIEELSEIDGVGEVLAKNIFEFFNHKNVAMLFELQSLGVNMKSQSYNTNVNINEGKFAGKTFVITGTLSSPRSEIIKIIEDNGGKVSGSVSKKTDYLLCGENAGSKLEKAKSLQIKVLSENELFTLLDNI